MNNLKSVLSFLPTVLRLLFGLMLISTGLGNLGRDDPAAWLAEQINMAIVGGHPFGFYEPFLRGVVAPNFALFAGLVGAGEFLSGVSLTLGAAHRLGAAVISFQFLNYGLLGGWIGLLSHTIMTILVLIPVFLQSGRRFGIDRWLVARWPNAKVW